MKEPDQTPTLAERLLFRIKLILAQPLAGQPITAEMIRALSEAGTEADEEIR